MHIHVNINAKLSDRFIIRVNIWFRKEIKEWSQVMIERMKELKPLIACFNGKGIHIIYFHKVSFVTIGIYEIFSGVKKCEVGIQTEPLPDTETVSHCYYLLYL